MENNSFEHYVNQRDKEIDEEVNPGVADRGTKSSSDRKKKKEFNLIPKPPIDLPGDEGITKKKK